MGENMARLRRYDLLLLALAVGVIVTVTRFHFGSNDHVETLLLIERLRDPGFIAQDYFANLIGAAATVRAYFVLPITIASRLLSLPLIFFLLTLAVNCGVALATVGASRALFRSKSAAFLTLGLSVFVTVPLGTYGGFYAEWVVPTAISKALLMLGAWALLEKRLEWSVLCFGAAALIHPQDGPVLGGLMLFAAALSRQFSWRDLGALGGMFALICIAVIVPQMSVSERLNDADYILIRAFFHIPDHSAPSVFSENAYRLFAGLMVAASAAWLLWRMQGRSWQQGWAAVMAVGILLLMLTGWLFVEVLPTRLFVMLQPFRYHVLLDWLAVIIVLGAAVRAGERIVPRIVPGMVRALTALSLVVFGLSTPSLGVITGWNDVEIDADIAVWLRENTPTDAIIAAPLRWEQLRFLARRAIVVEFKGGTTMLREAYWGEWIERLQALYDLPFAYASPIMNDQTLSSTERNERARQLYLDTARYARRQLFLDAVENYRHISDERLALIAQEYGADYAVLYRETTTTLPELFATEAFKIVALN
jgi:hypothetical protein